MTEGLGIYSVVWTTPDGRTWLIDFDDEGNAQRFAYAVELSGNARDVLVSGPQEAKPDPERERRMKERLDALWRLQRQKTEADA